MPPNNATLPRAPLEPRAEPQKFASLAEVARLINSSSDLPAVLNRIVAAVCQHSSWASCGIMAVNRKAELSELVVRYDPLLDPATNPPTSWTLGQSATMRVVETNQPVIIDDAQSTDEFPAYREDAILRGYRTVVVLPLGTTDELGRDMTIAVHSRARVSVTETELAFLVTVTQLASIAVEKAKRVQFEQDRAARLRRTIEISTLLVERVLADASLETTIAMIAAVVPHPLVIADLVSGTFGVCRSPMPRLLDEARWKNIVNRKLGSTIADLVRAAAYDASGAGRKLTLAHDDELVQLEPTVAPLQVNGETVGGLLIFPPQGGLDDLDRMVAHAAKLALNVQLMRDYVRFRSEASSISELFNSLFSDTLRNPGEIMARAHRLNVALAGPARLVAIGFLGDEGDSAERGVGLHLTLSRAAAELRPRAQVILDRDVLLFVPVDAGAEAGAWDRFLHIIAATVENHLAAPPIIVTSRVCRRLADYREARLECARVMSLARIFGKTGPMSLLDFGPFAVLLSALDQETTRDFVEQTLGAVRDHDARHRSQLLRTLAEFLRTGGRYQACADELGIHVSTLRYRLDRLRDLFDIEFDNPDAVFGLMLALRLRDLGTRRRTARVSDRGK